MNQKSRSLRPTLLYNSCVAMNKLPNLSEPLSPVLIRTACEYAYCLVLCLK